MLRYVYGHDDVVAQFVAQMIPHVDSGFDKCVTIGVLDGNDKLIAGIVFHDWQPAADTIQISAAALPKRKWLTRETLRRMYEYPFEQCGCQMVIQNTPADAERLLRQLSVLGYMFVEVPRILGRNRNIVACLLTKESWESNRILKRARRQPIADMKEAA